MPRQKQEVPDLRYSYDDKEYIPGGVIYRKDNVVQVVFNNPRCRPDTTFLKSPGEARVVFQDKIKHYS